LPTIAKAGDGDPRRNDPSEAGQPALRFTDLHEVCDVTCELSGFRLKLFAALSESFRFIQQRDDVRIERR
jgi:hypothetical protein